MDIPFGCKRVDKSLLNFSLPTSKLKLTIPPKYGKMAPDNQEFAMSVKQIFTIESFRDYWKTNERLTIPAGHTLLIMDVAYLFRSQVITHADLDRYTERSQLIGYIISQILIPQGYTAFPAQGQGAIKGTFLHFPNIEMTPDQNFTWVKSFGVIPTRIHALAVRLIQEMGSYKNIIQILNPKTEIAFLDHDPRKICDYDDSYQTMCVSHSPAGYAVQFFTKKCTVGPQRAPFEPSISVLGISGPLEFIVGPKGQFGSVEEYAEHMETIGEFYIPTYDVGRRVDGVKRELTRRKNCRLLEAILLPWGLSVEGDEGVKYKAEDELLMITGQKEVTVKAKRADVFTTLAELGKVMLTVEKFYFTIGSPLGPISRGDQTNTSSITGTQKLIFTDVGAESFEAYLEKNAPSGYKWRLSSPLSVSPSSGSSRTLMSNPQTENRNGSIVDSYAAHLMALNFGEKGTNSKGVETNGSGQLVLSSEEPMRLELVPITDEWLTGRVRKLYLGRGLYEKPGARQVIMLAIYRHLRAFHMESGIRLPDTLKETTRVKVEALLKDKEFVRLLEQLEGSEGRFAIDQLALSAAEFDGLMATRNWPIPVKSLFTKLTPIAEEELKDGSPFYVTVTTKVAKK